MKLAEMRLATVPCAAACIWKSVGDGFEFSTGFFFVGGVRGGSGLVDAETGEPFPASRKRKRTRRLRLLRLLERESLKELAARVRAGRTMSHDTRARGRVSIYERDYRRHFSFILHFVLELTLRTS